MAIICLLFAGMNCYKPPMSAKLTIGFLGAGRMGTALAKGFIQAGLVAADQIIASDPVAGACADFGKEVGARTTASNVEVVKFAKVLLFAGESNHDSRGHVGNT